MPLLALVDLLGQSGVEPGDYFLDVALWVAAVAAYVLGAFYFVEAGVFELGEQEFAVADIDVVIFRAVDE